MRMALRAQAQSRTTIETLSTIKTRPMLPELARALREIERASVDCD